MKRLLGITIATLMMTTSQASSSIPQNGNELYGKPTAIAVQPQTVTLNAQGHVKSRIPKPKLFRANPHRLSHFALLDDQDDIFIADDDLATGYRRRDLNKLEHDEDELPQRILDRLASAREKALEVYKKKWG